MIHIEQVLYAYNNLKENHEYLSSFDIGRHLGYLEACVHQFGYLETEKEGNRTVVKREVKSNKTWYRKEQVESVKEAILRMTEKLLKDKNLL